MHLRSPCSAAWLVALAPVASSQASHFALRFHGADNGLTDRVRIRVDDNEGGADHSASIDLGAGSFTIEFWVRGTVADNPTSHSGGHVEFADSRWLEGSMVVDRSVLGPSQRHWGVSIAGGFVRFGTGAGDAGVNQPHTLEGGVDVLDGTWRHVACVRDAVAGVKSIYVDGVLDVESSPGVSTSNLSYPNAGVPGSGSPWGPWLMLGARKHPGAPGLGGSFRGSMDEFRLWKRALGGAEIASIRDVVLDGDETALVGYYRFEEGSGTSAPDWSAAGAPAGLILNALPGDGEWVSSLADPSATAPVKRDSLPPGFELRLLSADLVEPTSMACLPDGRILIGERSGCVRVWMSGAFLSEPLIQIPAAATNAERGLHALRLDPDFAVNGWIYAHYTTAEPRNRVSRFTVVGDTASWASEYVVWENTDLAAGIHHGGALEFGADQRLYIATGDQSDSMNSRNLANQHGKLLRLERDGSIPLDNPFLGTPGADPAIFALGLRNPFRAALDALTGELFIGDVGGNAASSWEEVERVSSGADYGWPLQEGADCHTSDCGSMQPPLWGYRHDDPTYIEGDVQACVMVGAVYRGTAFPAAYDGSLFVADYANRWIRRLNRDAQGAVQSESVFLRAPDAGSIVELEVGADGALYFLTFGLHNSGATDVAGLHRIRYIGVDNLPPVPVASASVVSGAAPLGVQFTSAGTHDPDQGPGPLEFLWTFGDGQSSNEPDPFHTYVADGPYSARLEVRDGAVTAASSPIEIAVGAPPTATILAPAPHTLYRAGDTIVFHGAGDDGEGGALGPQALTWRVLLVHESHAHPFLGPFTGSGGSFQVPTTGHAPAHTHFEIQLEATDPSGLRANAAVSLDPHTTMLHFASNPPGVVLFVDGEPVTTPATIPSLVGFQHWIEAPAAAGSRSFRTWSDGGAIGHTYVVQLRNRKLIAYYSQ